MSHFENPFTTVDKFVFSKYTKFLSKDSASLMFQQNMDLLLPETTFIVYQSFKSDEYKLITLTYFIQVCYKIVIKFTE